MSTADHQGVYRPPTVTVDTVLFGVRRDGRRTDGSSGEGQLEVLLITRGAEPFKGERALPGVYMAEGETIRSASDRCLVDKAGIALPGRFEQRTVGVHDEIARDPRGHAISIVQLALCDDPSAVECAPAARWAVVDRIVDRGVGGHEGAPADGSATLALTTT